MRKKFLLLFIALFGLVLVACEEKTKYTVTFETSQGTTVQSVEVFEGDLIERPSDPRRDGFTFDGWFKEAAFTTEWKFEEDKVTANITIYAKWTPETVVPPIAKTVKVTFDFNYSGASVPITKEYDENTKITDAPTIPTREDFEFIGWSTSRTSFVKFDLEDNVTEDITLYATWESTKTLYTVTLDLNYNDLTEEVAVYDGELAEFVQPTRDGYLFVEWLLDGEVFSLDTPITANITLVAKWLLDDSGLEGTAIVSSQQLIDLFTNGGEDTYYLAQDIDMTGVEFEGSASNFSGVFDGNGKRIYNFHVDLGSNNKSGAMFGFLESATVKNLIVMRSSITGTTEGIGFIAYSVSEGTTFEDITFINVSIKSTGNYAGLLYADNADVTVGIKPITINNIVLNNDNTNEINAGRYVGGLVGHVRNQQNINMSNVYFNSKVRAVNNSTAGALIGRVNNTDSVINISNAVVKGDVSASANYVGSIFGETNVGAKINVKNVLLDNLTTTSGGGSYGLVSGRIHNDLELTEENVFYTESYQLFSHGGETNRNSELNPDQLVEVTEAWFNDSEFNKELFKYEDGTLLHKIDLGPVVPEGLAIDQNSYNDVFVLNVDVEIDLSSLEIYVSFSDGSTQLIDLNDEKLDIDKTAFKKDEVGVYDIVVSYEGLEEVIKIEVVEITKLNVYTLDIDKLYLLDETIDLNAVVVKALLADGSELLINNEDLEFEYTKALGEQIVTLTYKDEYDVEFSITFVDQKLVAADDRTKVIVDEAFEGTSGSLVEGVVTVKTVEEAINLVEKSDLATEVIKEVFIKEGLYFEKLRISAPNMLFIGEDRDSTIIDFDNANGILKPAGGTWGTQGSASVTIAQSATGFTAYNLTFSNSFDYNNSTISNKQAVALVNEADKALFYQVSFKGFQDTLYAKNGRQWYLDIYVEGVVDFIFGNGGPAFFENSEIKSLTRETGAVAAPKGIGKSDGDILEYGYVFLNNKFTFEEGTPAGSVDLGRPWGKNALAAFINNELGAHISERGYVEMSGNKVEDARFSEFGNTQNNEAYTSTFGTKLTAEDAALLSDKAVIFQTTNGLVTFETEWDYIKQLALVAPELVATVSIDADNEDDVLVHHVLVGKKLSEPETPLKQGFEFLGWYVGEEVFDFNNEITTDLEIVAKWEEITEGFTVTFKDGEDVLFEQLVVQGGNVTAIDNPTKVGFDFVEWQLDGVAFDLSTPINKDITLFAVWKDSEFKPIEGSIPIEQAADFYSTINSDRAANYHLTADLDFSDITDYSPMSNFSGRIDGLGFKIKNLTINSGDRGGLFNYLHGGIIINLGFDNVHVTSSGRAGLIAGSSRYENGSIVENVEIFNASVKGNNDNGVGLLIGDVYNNIKVTNLHVHGTVSVENEGKQTVGGLFGKLDGRIKSSSEGIEIPEVEMSISNVLIENISLIGGDRIGGIVGDSRDLSGKGFKSENVVVYADLQSSTNQHVGAYFGKGASSNTIHFVDTIVVANYLGTNSNSDLGNFVGDGNSITRTNSYIVRILNGLEIARKNNATAEELLDPSILPLTETWFENNIPSILEVELFTKLFA